jgi:hypothetical protein
VLLVRAALRGRAVSGTLGGTPMTVRTSALFLVLMGLPLFAESSDKTTLSCPAFQLQPASLNGNFRLGAGWYGDQIFAVQLPSGGSWHGMGATHNFRDKLFWWGAGFGPGHEGDLVVSARHLDADATAVISRVTGAYYDPLIGSTMLVAVEFPVAGCWEISGTYKGKTIVFAVYAS